MEKTLVLLKPDCVQRRLVGTILQRFEQKGLRLVAMKLVQATRSWPRRITRCTRTATFSTRC